ncbi:MAG: hypothetical protein UT37_C0011G0002 [Parcubacteria group bacterium GW2011_GWA2_39_18]|nr:MAG: hypothetical protein UT37_C0011G0002 [Parcubacteria group bacterium GW2011_GWA2_39_18]
MPLRLPILSENHPEIGLSVLARASAAPSMKPTKNAGAPKVTVKKAGITDCTISAEKSLKKLTSPKKKIFFLTPNIFLSVSIMITIL